MPILLLLSYIEKLYLISHGPLMYKVQWRCPLKCYFFASADITSGFFYHADRLWPHQAITHSPHSRSLPDLYCVIPKSGINNADFHAGTLTEFMMGKKGKWKEWISVKKFPLSKCNLKTGWHTVTHMQTFTQKVSSCFGTDYGQWPRVSPSTISCGYVQRPRLAGARVLALPRLPIITKAEG